jgi:16S rRNA C967 or C1407 C5-methylase (RsmB/RsmF family)/NOL1/NOP2/fmu family ribosome biogenesis protein
LQLPPSLLQHIQQFSSFAIDEFVAAHQQPAVTSLRIHPQKKENIAFNTIAENEVIATALQQNTTPVPWCTNGYYLPQRPSFITDPLIHAGAYYVQEASSMFLQFALQQIAENTSNMVVLDACAAPGGKSTLLSSFFTEGLVVSNEVIKNRAAILVENITKWGNGNVVVTNNDVKQLGALENLFDVIVIDAPCSGSGLFRKDAQAIEEWSEANVALCSQRQQRIVADLLPALKQGGKLVYCTCSYSTEENEALVDFMLDNFALQNIALQPSTNWGIVTTTTEKHAAVGYRFFPNLVKGEGFFMAVFEKTNGHVNCYLPEHTLYTADKHVMQMLKKVLQVPNAMEIIEHQHQYIGVYTNHVKTIQQLSKLTYIKKIGVDIGTIKGKDIVPHHALAVSVGYTDYEQIIEVNKEQALQFLRRKEMAVTTPFTGWCLLQYCGLNLGWIKVLPNRINNYYPTEWRILKD